MNDNRLLQKYAGAKQPQPDEQAASEGEGLDDLGVCGVLRGIRDRAIMLELRLKDGAIEAFAYAYLSHARFDPSEGIELHFGAKTVKIVGRNVGMPIRQSMTLVNAIVRHRLAWVQEADEPASFAAPRQAVVVDEIKIE